jgi:hypothetical protein
VGTVVRPAHPALILHVDVGGSAGLTAGCAQTEAVTNSSSLKIVTWVWPSPRTPYGGALTLAQRSTQSRLARHRCVLVNTPRRSRRSTVPLHAPSSATTYVLASEAKSGPHF